jgi:signal transduction histidine kinase
MRTWRAFALIGAVAVAGALGTLAVGAIAGMHPSELAHLGLLLLPAILATAVATLVARPLLARSSFLVSMVAVSAIAATVGVVTLAVLASQMFLGGHDATTVVVLLLYSLGAGVGAALVVARSSVDAVERLVATAEAIAEGDHQARAGDVGASPELAALARTLDRMADRLQEAVAIVENVERRRRDLVIAVSHDLRTPLAGLRAMVEAIEDGVADDPGTIQRYAVEIRRSVDVLVTLTDDLFELVQLDEESILRGTAQARLQDVVRSAVAACHGQAVAKGVAVHVDLTGASDVSSSVRLVRVLQNLLQNAIRHTPADGDVRLEAWRDADGVRLCVQDSGQGIPAEMAAQVFEPFWRGDPARSGGGSGLGLALAKRIVEALGGTIAVDSGPPGGARFSVRLPSAPPVSRRPTSSGAAPERDRSVRSLDAPRGPA